MHHIQHIGIVGCGVCGRGIARVAALSGYEVHVCERSLEILEQAFEESSIFFKRQSIGGTLSDTEVYEVFARIHGSLDLHDLEGSDIVIEAIHENLDDKIRLFQELDQLFPPSTILASHSSSFSIAKIASVTQHPERVAGLHFFYPIHLVKLVEVVKTPFLPPAVLEIIYDFVRSLKKQCITVADAPGFVVNRLLLPYLLNAVRIFEAGIATKEDIDKAMQLGCGYPIGPFALMDFLGLDHIYQLAENFYQAYQDLQYAPPLLLKQLVEEGHLGKETGKGFYNYQMSDEV